MWRIGLRLHQRPQPSRETLAAAGVDQHRVEYGPEHVVLALIEGAVTDSDGPGTA